MPEGISAECASDGLLQQPAWCPLASCRLHSAFNCCQWVGVLLYPCCFLGSWAVDCYCTAQVRCSRALERLHVIHDQWKEQMYMLTITQSNPETLAEGAVCRAGVCGCSTHCLRPAFAGCGTTVHSQLRVAMSCCLSDEHGSNRCLC